MRTDTVIGLAFAGVLGLVLLLRVGEGGLTEEQKEKVRAARRTF